MNIYERCGRLLEERDIEAEAHRNTLNLLRHLKDGDVSFDNIELTENGWRVNTPQEPACEVTDG